MKRTYQTRSNPSSRKRFFFQKKLPCEMKLLLWEKMLRQAVATIQRLQAEVEYYQSPGFYLECFESVKKDYGLFLNPPPIELQTTHKGKKTAFKIELQNLISVKGARKLKKLYLKEQILSTDGEFKTDMVVVEMSWEDLMHPNVLGRFFPLCEVSKSWVVHVGFYSMKGKKLMLTEKNRPVKLCDEEVSITPDYIEAFTTRKKTLDNMISFLNSEFPSFITDWQGKQQ
jgi:hypothetical protein